MLAFTATGRGTQIYQCKASADGGFAWTLKGPDGVLTDGNGAVIGRHYEGPTWEGEDGSKVVGQILARAPSPTDGVDWLLLKASSHSGQGRFASVTYVRRLETVGGKAPADGCSQATVHQTTAVPYSATYEFYRPQG